MKKILLAITLLFGFSATTMAIAGNRSGAITFSPMVGYYLFDSKNTIDNEFLPNLHLAYNFTSNWGGELGLGWFDAKTDTASQLRVDGGLYTINGLYHILPQKRFDPYLTAGTGILYLRNPLSKFSNSQAILNGGAGAQYFVTPNIALRGDVRDVYTMRRGTQDVLFGLGLSFLFGGQNGTQWQHVSDQQVRDVILAHYGVDKDRVPAADVHSLQSFAKMMRLQAHTNAEIVGYTDSTGSTGYNLKLSQRRAQNVRNYLVHDLGVDPTSLMVTAKGESEPQASNSTRAGRAQNRRVDAVLYTEHAHK